MCVEEHFKCFVYEREALFLFVCFKSIQKTKKKEAKSLSIKRVVEGEKQTKNSAAVIRETQ